MNNEEIKKKLSKIGFTTGINNRFFKRVGERIEIEFDDFGFITIVRKSEFTFKDDRLNYSKVTIPKKIETKKDIEALMLLFKT